MNFQYLILYYIINIHTAYFRPLLKTISPCGAEWNFSEMYLDLFDNQILTFTLESISCKSLLTDTIETTVCVATNSIRVTWS